MCRWCSKDHIHKSLSIVIFLLMAVAYIILLLDKHLLYFPIVTETWQLPLQLAHKT